MSDWITQEKRKAENMAAAVEAIRATGLPTPRLDEALAEPLIADEHKLTAGFADLSEGFARLHTAYNHTAEHIDPSQDAEIGRLRERVEKPKSGSGAAKK